MKQDKRIDILQGCVEANSLCRRSARRPMLPRCCRQDLYLEFCILSEYHEGGMAYFDGWMDAIFSSIADFGEVQFRRSAAIITT